MNACISSHLRIGRRTRLATCLGIALALGTGGTVCASTSQNNPFSTQANVSGSLITGLPGNTFAHQHNTALLPAVTSLAPGAIRAVNNCNNAGTGSLRDTIDNAGNGDTIDMSGLPDCTISLTSSIVTSIPNLTLKGKPGTTFVFPLVVVNGQDLVRPITHTGTGSIRLKDMSIRNGKLTRSSSASGGCLYSAGTIRMTDSFVQSCKAHSTGGSPASGGAIYARNSIFLYNTQVTNSTALSSGNGDAKGGGVYSGSGTVIRDGSLISGNKAEADGNGRAEGGGVSSFGQGVVLDSTINNNTASSMGDDAQGGGIACSSYLFVSGAQINGNLAQSGAFAGLGGEAYGGGIWAAGKLAVQSSTISGNQGVADTSALGAFSMGGGIAADGDAAIDRSTISGNTAERTAGAALTGSHASVPLSITSSTISGNVSSNSGTGSGLFLGHDAGVFNSTITDNTESNPSDMVVAAGLFIEAGASVALSSSIVAGNRLHRGDNTDVHSDLGGNGGNSGDHDLVGHSTLQWSQGDVIFDTTPDLEPLADNGGPTKTHALRSSSQAINAGLALGESTDQRGPGFSRIAGAAPDIGAFELQIDDRIFANGFD